VGGFARPVNAWPLPNGAVLIPDENDAMLVRINPDGTKTTLLRGLGLPDDVVTDSTGAGPRTRLHRRGHHRPKKRLHSDRTAGHRIGRHRPVHRLHRTVPGAGNRPQWSAHGRLRREIEGVTQKMLTTTLRDLQRSGLVHRKDYDEVPPRVEYTFGGPGAQPARRCPARVRLGRGQYAAGRSGPRRVRRVAGGCPRGLGPVIG
jgi:hypothetical protein